MTGWFNVNFIGRFLFMHLTRTKVMWVQTTNKVVLCQAYPVWIRSNGMQTSLEWVADCKRPWPHSNCLLCQLFAFPTLAAISCSTYKQKQTVTQIQLMWHQMNEPLNMQDVCLNLYWKDRQSPRLGHNMQNGTEVYQN